MNVRTDACNESEEGWRNLRAERKEIKKQHENDEGINEKMMLKKQS